MYEERYQQVLSKLDAHAIYDKLLEYGEEKDVVMLCCEPPGEFFHRYLVSQWLKEQLDVEVEEWI